MIHHGDLFDVLPTLPEASIDACVTDPPYALPGGFMGKKWDRFDGHEDAGFCYWLSGLIDGEGCFTIKAHTRGTHAPCFSLKLRADEEGTLQAIKRAIKIGTLTREDRDPNPTVRWTVADKAGCQRLVDLLDKYPLRAKKRMDYEVWREAVCEWSARPRGNRWHGAADDSRMAQLRLRLMNGRAYEQVAWSGDEYQDWCRLWGREVFRALKPGGYLLAFGAPRAYHRMVCGLEDAGFEVRDSVLWLQGAGFPKSLDVSKAIDRQAGAEREVVGKAPWSQPAKAGHHGGLTGDHITESDGRYTPDVTAPATEAAKNWAGWGTALKPGHEQIVVARKPLDGTVAENVLKHGTGALNIDACRIESRGDGDYDHWREPGNIAPHDGFEGKSFAAGQRSMPQPHDLGRWPANVVLDEDAAQLLDQQTGELTSGFMRAGTEREGIGYHGGLGNTVRNNTIGDSGGASRFFYTAKPSRAERDSGIYDLEPRPRDESRKEGNPGGDNPRNRGLQKRGNHHPTVKPVELMRWLVRLVTPIGGTVLDPFTGSGTTGMACAYELRPFIGIEREADYIAIAERRIAACAPLFQGEHTA